MKSILTTSLTALSVATILAFAPARANAALIITFDQLVLDGGSVVSIGGGGDAEGTDIIFTAIYLVDTVTGTQAGLQCGDATSAAGATVEDACMLDFNTSTGSFTVTADGGLYDMGADLLPYTADTGAQIVAPGTIILSGTINSFVFLPGQAFLGFGVDTKDADMLEFFGLSPTLSFNFSNSELLMGLDGDNVTEADLTNTIPEPGSLTLLGLGLLAAGRAIRRPRVGARA